MKHNKDPLHFPRTELANSLLISLRDGISHALTLFAPRRMGKTKFLIEDIKPLAEEMGFNVFYYSFMEQSQRHQTETAFIQALADFLDKASNGKSKVLEALNKIGQIEVLGVGVSLNETAQSQMISVSQIIAELAEKSPKPILMLLDEIQELARIKGTETLVKSLRTGLDINQNKVKVIFTGSSTNGLRSMFNDHKAPFFHFAHSLDFPNLPKNFTDFLADIYQERTGKQIDKQAFYALFQRFNYTPLYLRAITQDMIINPNLTLEQATQSRISQLEELTDYAIQWQSLSALEKELIKAIYNNDNNLYSKKTKEQIAQKLGIENLSSSSIQGKIRKLEKAEIITRDAGNTLKINNPYFQTWIAENI
ncbi:ATP-binding protein [Ursidibacter sp. B-7004-1]